MEKLDELVFIDPKRYDSLLKYSAGIDTAEALLAAFLAWARVELGTDDADDALARCPTQVLLDWFDYADQSVQNYGTQPCSWPARELARRLLVQEAKDAGRVPVVHVSPWEGAICQR